jgi:hypothetical protein
MRYASKTSDFRSHFASIFIVSVMNAPPQISDCLPQSVAEDAEHAGVRVAGVHEGSGGGKWAKYTFTGEI